MWKRATWHDCAAELQQISERFCRAYPGAHPRDLAIMQDASREGVQLLRALALAIRSEQDFALLPEQQSVVGALKSENAEHSDAREFKEGHGSYTVAVARDGFAPLRLRQALNKIAHADPEASDYYVGSEGAHDLLLYGTGHGRSWFAAISIPRLVSAIRALPDANMA